MSMLIRATQNHRSSLAFSNASNAFVVPGDSASRNFADADHTGLIREAQRGSSAAFEELVRTYDRAVLCLALRLTRSEADAQDIYQDAFLRAYQSLASFRFECSFYTWIYRITTNVCLDYLRRRRNHLRRVQVVTVPDETEFEPVENVPDAHPASDPHRCLRTRELRRQIAHSLDQLPPRERMVFELKHYQGLKLRTIAEMLHTSEGTIKNTLFRATHKLRCALAEAR